jgi:hypothetical protein
MRPSSATGTVCVRAPFSDSNVHAAPRARLFRLRPAAGSRAILCRQPQASERHDFHFLLSGTYALSCYTGITPGRPRTSTSSASPRTRRKILSFFKEQGYQITIEDERWIGKVWQGEQFFDVIYNISSASIPITDEWFAEQYEAEVYGTSVRITPPTQFILSKLFLQTRYRYDMADIVHVMLRKHDQIDWQWLLNQLELYWEVLLINILNFRFVYPSERHLIPHG